jgi:hypothetical protein
VIKLLDKIGVIEIVRNKEIKLERVKKAA